MKLPGDAGALRETFFEPRVEPGGYLPNTQAKDRPRDAGERRSEQDDEPASLVEVRLLIDEVGDARAIPDSTSIASTNPKRMGSDRHVAVDRPRVGASVEPLGVDVIQSVLHANLFRR